MSTHRSASIDLVFAAPPLASLAVTGARARFPVRRVYAVGRNYAAHAAETGLGGAARPTPGFSLKPADSVIAGGAIPYPPGTSHLDPEIELVVAIGRGGADIAPHAALDHVFGYAVGFDMIRRDVMRACIENQHSWDLCKSFDGASPCGELRRAAEIGHPARGAIGLRVNGEMRQDGDLADMIWPPAEIIARLSGLSRLEPGDLIFTGTPRGPAPVLRGDRLDGRIDGVGTLEGVIV
jgi:fumarylpyruvate hydrolase